MKTGASKIFRSFCKPFFFLTFLLLGSLWNSWSQETEPAEADSVKTGVALGQLRMEDPESIVSKYTYDPKLDRYIYSEVNDGL